MNQQPNITHRSLKEEYCTGGAKNCEKEHCNVHFSNLCYPVNGQLTTMEVQIRNRSRL